LSAPSIFPRQASTSQAGKNADIIGGNIFLSDGHKPGLYGFKVLGPEFVGSFPPVFATG
jgi:hypothetical protein